MSVRGLLFLSLLALGSCQEGMGPVSPPLPPPPAPGAPPPEPFNPGPSFGWENTRGILVFAGTQAREGQIRTLDSRLRTAWNKTPVYNVCSEVAEWEQTPWADGPAAFSRENLDNLRRFLNTAADLSSYVRLNIFCTVRDNHGWMERHAEEYTRTIAKIASEYDHVFLSVANEPWHPASWLRQEGRVRQVRDWARRAGFTGPMGADDNIGAAHLSFEYAYRSLGFPADFHPYRNPDPTRRAIERIAEINGFFIISEPTAYSSWRDERCCTGNRDQIVQYMRRVENAGGVWFFHSTDGLQWPQLVAHFEWIPE